MSPSSSLRAYSTGAMLLHWAIALLVVFQIGAGFAMERIDGLSSGLRFALIQWHKTIGVLILALTLARIAWRLFHKPPAHAPMSRVELWTSHAVHMLFYAMMIILPVSGWLLVSASKLTVPTLLFLQETLVWPHIPVPAATKEGVHAAAELVHLVLGYVFAALLALHVAGALKHSLVDRVPSFSRMLPLGRLRLMPSSAFGAVVAVMLSTSFLAGGLWLVGTGGTHREAVASESPSEMPPATSGWVVDKAKSTLGYEVDFSGSPTAGAIGRWDASIRFDPDALAEARAGLTIDASSITFDDDYVSPNLPGEDGLNITAHPTVRVDLNRFSKTETGFLGAGTATIRGTALPVEVPFTFTVDAATGRARAQGTATLDRLAFGLGKIGDEKAEWIGKTIQVKFAFEAAPASPGS